MIAHINSNSSASTPEVGNICEGKLASFQTEQSIISSSTRKKYFLKRTKLPDQLSTSPSRSNIFDLTSGLNSSYLEVGISCNSQA